MLTKSCQLITLRCRLGAFGIFALGYPLKPPIMTEFEHKICYRTVELADDLLASNQGESVGLVIRANAQRAGCIK